MVAPPTTPRNFAVDVARASAAFQDLARQMGAQFLDKQEIIRLMVVSAIAGEHMLLIGPPGTAKSALVRLFSKLVQARYFEYLLTRFTEPNEIFGPIDIQRFREGQYERRMEGMLPEAEIAFLDEVFKANSAILNSLLGVLNERVYTVGGHRHCVRARRVCVTRLIGGGERCAGSEHAFYRRDEGRLVDELNDVDRERLVE